MFCKYGSKTLPMTILEVNKVARAGTEMEQRKEKLFDQITKKLAVLVECVATGSMMSCQLKAAGCQITALETQLALVKLADLASTAKGRF